MNGQLKNAIELFNKHNINYWLDSGTLLGAVRDGDVAKGDDDIDFSIWIDDLKKLNPLLRDFEKNYYEQRGIRYVPESIILKSKKEDDLHISIHFYHKEGKHAYCFMRAVRPLSIKRRSLEWVFWLFPHFMYNLIGRILKSGDPRKHPLGRSKFFLGDRMMYDIPTEIIGKTKVIKITEDIDAKVPEKYKEYLSLRYGNWKIPDRNWNIMKDGAMLRIVDWLKNEKV